MHVDQLLLLVDCLVESHLFARNFNSNHEQRNLLWKAGSFGREIFSRQRDEINFLLGAFDLVLFIGYRGKAKPNLLAQETLSIACALRILFRIFNDKKKENSAETIKRRILK